MLQAAQKSNLFIEALDSSLAIFFTCIRADEQFFHGIVVWRIRAYLFNFINGTHTTFAKNLYHSELAIKSSSYRESHTPVFSKRAQRALTCTTTAVILSSPPFAFAMLISKSQIFCGLLCSLSIFSRSCCRTISHKPSEQSRSTSPACNVSWKTSTSMVLCPAPSER